MKDDFETKLDDIKKIIEKLSDGNLNLTKSMQAYNEGMTKIKEASVLLEKAKLIIEEK